MVDPDVYYSRFPEDNYYAFEYYASLARPEFFDEDVSHSSSYSSPAQRSISPTVLSETFYDDNPPSIAEEPVKVPDVAQIKNTTKKVKKKKKFTCSHCKKPPTIRKHIHPETGLIVCRSCYLFVKKYGRDKKLVVEICSNCKLLMGDKEHPVTAVSLCSKCFVHLQRYGRYRTDFSRDIFKILSTNDLAETGASKEVESETLQESDSSIESLEDSLEAARRKKKSAKLRETMKNKRLVKCAISHCPNYQKSLHRHPVGDRKVCKGCHLFYTRKGRDRTKDELSVVCQNCKTNRSSGNHPVTDIALCRPCLSYYKQKGRDRSNFKLDQPFRKYKLDPVHGTQNCSNVESSRDNLETQVENSHLL